MSSKSKPVTKSNTSKPANKPVMRLYLVTKKPVKKDDGQSTKERWTEIGAIWFTKAGFYSVDFSLPLDLRPFFFSELFSFVIIREDEKEKKA